MWIFNRKIRQSDISAPLFLSGWLAILINEFRRAESKKLVEITLRGQRAIPIKQIDIDGAISTGETLVVQKVVELKSEILFLEQEINDLGAQLAEPLDIGQSVDQSPSIFTRVINFVFKNKPIKNLKGGGYGRNEISNK